LPARLPALRANKEGRKRWRGRVGEEAGRGGGGAEAGPKPGGDEEGRRKIVLLLMLRGTGI
jgi:hypothetical protein